MQDKFVKCGDQEIHFKSTGSTPRLYRLTFGKDLFADMQKLQFDEGQEMSPEAMEIFENIAYVMAKHGAMADKKEKEFPKSVTEWLDSFDMLEFYTTLPEILELWGANIATQSISKKK